MSVYPNGGNWRWEELKEARLEREELEMKATWVFGPISNISELSNKELRDIINRKTGGEINRE